MATSFSRGYKIKLIGTGLEAGTWGTSTNENLKRIDQYFAGGTDFDVTAASLPSSWNGSSNTLTWCLGDATDAWDTGSEGRNRFVNFTTATSSITVNIRGSTSTDDQVERIYWVRNSLGSNRTILFNNNESSSSGDFTLRDGATALIHATSAGNVESILGELQLTGITFVGSDADIILKDNTTAALEIKTTNANEEFIRIDTDNNHLELAPGSSIAQVDWGAGTVDASGQNVLVLTNQNHANSLVFQESGGSVHLLRLDTTTGANKIVFPTEMFIHTGTIDTQNQVTTFEIKDGEDSPTDASGGALRIREGAAGPILFGVRTGTDPVLEVSEAATLKLSGSTGGRNALEVAGTSTFGSNQADFSAINIDGGTIDGTPINNSTIGASTANTGKFTTLEATTASTALHLSAADAYLSLGATAGSGGHGLRDNSGTLNIKNTNSDAWGEPYHSGMVNGQGTYFEASSVYGGQGNYQFTHGLTIPAQGCPRIVEAWLQLTDSTSQFGYDQYDWILIGSRTGGGDNQRGATVWANTSTVTATVGSQGLRIFNSTGGGNFERETVPTDSTWSIVVRAWK